MTTMALLRSTYLPYGRGKQSAAKPYLARISGTHATYDLDRHFIQAKEEQDGRWTTYLWEAERCVDGLYEMRWADGDRTYYVLRTRASGVREFGSLGKTVALEYARLIDAGHSLDEIRTMRTK